MSSLARAADVRNSNWGDTPDVVMLNEKDLTEQQSTFPRVKKLAGATVVGEKTFEVTYEFFDNKLARVKLSAVYHSKKIDRNNRDSLWNPFDEANGLGVTLREKYGSEKKEVCIENDRNASFSRALDWTSSRPFNAYHNTVWETGKTNIELTASSSSRYGINWYYAAVTYTSADIEAEYEEYTNAMREQEYKEKRKKEAEGL